MDLSTVSAMFQKHQQLNKSDQQNLFSPMSALFLELYKWRLGVYVIAALFKFLMCAVSHIVGQLRLLRVMCIMCAH